MHLLPFTLTACNTPLQKKINVLLNTLTQIHAISLLSVTFRGILEIILRKIVRQHLLLLKRSLFFFFTPTHFYCFSDVDCSM